MKNIKKIFLFSAILLCVVFLGRKFYDSYASTNTKGDYMLKGEPNTYRETISLNTNDSSNYTLKGEPNIYRETISLNTSASGSDYTLKGELNIYHETFPAISDDINSYNTGEMYSGNLVITEPMPLPEQ